MYTRKALSTITRGMTGMPHNAFVMIGTKFNAAMTS